MVLWEEYIRMGNIKEMKMDWDHASAEVVAINLINKSNMAEPFRLIKNHSRAQNYKFSIYSFSVSHFFFSYRRGSIQFCLLSASPCRRWHLCIEKGQNDQIVRQRKRKRLEWSKNSCEYKASKYKLI